MKGVALAVPAGWGLASSALVLGVRRSVADREAGARDPLLRLRGVCVGGSLTVT
jgi:hypothetical protein